MKPLNHTLRFLIVLGLLKVMLSPAGMSQAISLGDLTVPESLGKVSERYEGSGDRWVIQIQDIHANFTAQENIAAILDHLNRNYGINIIGLEGGWSQTSLPKSWSLPSSRHKQMLARRLMEDGHIGGPIFASLFAKVPMNIVGIEDDEIYKRNLNIYLKHLKSRTRLHRKLDKLEQSLAEQKAATYNPKLLQFDLKLVKFRNGEKAEQFLPGLVNRAKQLGLNIGQFAQITLFEEIMRMQKSIKKERLEEEANRLMQSFKKTQLTFEELLRNGRISQEKLQYYPQSKRYLQLMELQDQLDHHIFFDEIEHVIGMVKETLIENEAERELNESYERFVLARAIMLFKATPEQIKKYDEDVAAIEDDIFSWDLVEPFDLGLSFYMLAKKRDHVFYEKIKNDPRLLTNIAVITGGFHTDGMSKLFKEANISYIVITPEISEDKGDESLYVKRLQDPVPMNGALSHEKNRYAFFDENFPPSVEMYKKTNDLDASLARATQYSYTGKELNTLASALTYEEFIALEEEERMLQVQGLFEKAKTGNKSIAIVIKTSTLSKILESETGQSIWDKIVSTQRKNRIVLINDSQEYLEATVGIRAPVIRVGGDSSIDEVLETRLRRQSHIAVIDDNFKTNKKGTITLPGHPVSLLLARAVLESDLSVDAQDLDLLVAFEKELVKIFISEGLLRQSA